MALLEGCKHSLDITVPLSDVEQETTRVVDALKQKVRLPGFRPGKVPTAMIRSRFADDIRKGVLDELIPRYLRITVEKENFNIAGRPVVKEVHFHDGEPLRFRAELEVFPEFEIGEYIGLTASYQEPVVADEDVDKRLEGLREQKAEYVNIDPRPAEDGDYAVISLESRSGVDGKPIRRDEMTLHIGDPETMRDFSDNLKGMSPGDEKELDVTYPEDYAEERFSGKTIHFHMNLKALRRKELPDINDEFAQDLGDYKNIDELRDAVRNALLNEREIVARNQAKDEIIDRLVQMHDFPVPEAAVEQQLENIIETRLRELANQGVDPRTVPLDWEKIKETQSERARRDVKASLIIGKISEREALEPTVEELDRDIQRLARQRGEPVPAVRKALEKEGQLHRMANIIRYNKTLNFLFEKARKVAPQENA